jgi:hypothetical protein
MLTIGEELPEELLQVIADEVNVKQVVVSLGSPMELDTALTPELEQEGMVRELVRAVQGARKDAAIVAVSPCEIVCGVPALPASVNNVPPLTTQVLQLILPAAESAIGPVALTATVPLASGNVQVRAAVRSELVILPANRAAPPVAGVKRN